MTLRLSNLYSVIHPYVQDDARRVSREHWDVVTSRLPYGKELYSVRA